MFHLGPVCQNAMSDHFGAFGCKAAERGHLVRGHFHGGPYALHLAYAADADLDGRFEATCLDTGDLLKVNGWLYETEDDPADPANRAQLHPVLHAALASGACSPAVAAAIRDWGERDPIDAMVDARLLAKALRGDAGLVDRPDTSRVARRAYLDWMRDFAQDERVSNAEQLAKILTEWADTVLHEAIRAID